MKRVMCLYRVSTKGQVDRNTDDIPMQRRECMDFINRMDDWTFYDERVEKGVSGYKVSASKRDAITELRALAEKKQFDVLLVFMFDRLGRREDETPFLVEWFINKGIEVWSTREGQQKIENHGDRLINFIRFWQAGGESEKTSIRVKAAHTQMTEDGLWRGGTVPYGYKLVLNGRIGKRNRQLYDMAIDEIQGPIVREIFDLFAVQGYGSHRIANYLNAKYPDPKKIWTPPTIRTMIRNPMYTGRYHMNDVMSPPNESLRIVSDETFQFAQYALKQHITTRHTAARQAENDALPEDAPTKTSVYGASLLTGILYCASCGCKLVGTYVTKQCPDGAHHRPIYRCYNGAVKAKNCQGQTVYAAAKIDQAVIEVVRQYFKHITQTVNSVWKDQARAKLRSKVAAQVRAVQAEYEKLKRQEEHLQQEVMNSIMGNGTYDSSILKEMLTKNKNAMTEALEKLEILQKEKEEEDTRLKYLSEQYEKISDWAAEFDAADDGAKKMILSRLIEKITVDRNYQLTISFYVTEEAFFQQISQQDPSIQFEESEALLPIVAL